MQVLTVKEVADLLRVSRQTLYNMISKGKLPCFRVGNKVRFLRTDVETLMTPNINREKQNG